MPALVSCFAVLFLPGVVMRTASRHVVVLYYPSCALCIIQRVIRPRTLIVGSIALTPWALHGSCFWPHAPVGSVALVSLFSVCVSWRLRAWRRELRTGLVTHSVGGGKWTVTIVRDRDLAAPHSTLCLVARVGRPSIRPPRSGGWRFLGKAAPRCTNDSSLTF